MSSFDPIVLGTLINHLRFPALGWAITFGEFSVMWTRWDDGVNVYALTSKKHGLFRVFEDLFDLRVFLKGLIPPLTDKEKAAITDFYTLDEPCELGGPEDLWLHLAWNRPIYDMLLEQIPHIERFFNPVKTVLGVQYDPECGGAPDLCVWAHPMGTFDQLWARGEAFDNWHIFGDVGEQRQSEGKEDFKCALGMDFCDE